jgi:DNA-directed RNA polymerase subunit omega
MHQPSLDVLMEKMDSKYELVVCAARRARMLTEKSEIQADGRAMKPVSVALEEIATGKLWVVEHGHDC